MLIDEKHIRDINEKRFDKFSNLTITTEKIRERTLQSWDSQSHSKISNWPIIKQELSTRTKTVVRLVKRTHNPLRCSTWCKSFLRWQKCLISLIKCFNPFLCKKSHHEPLNHMDAETSNGEDCISVWNSRCPWSGRVTGEIKSEFKRECDKRSPPTNLFVFWSLHVLWDMPIVPWIYISGCYLKSAQTFTLHALLKSLHSIIIFVFL